MAIVKASSYLSIGQLPFMLDQHQTTTNARACFNPVTKQEITSDTFIFIPHTIPIPRVNINNFLHEASSYIVTLLQTPQPILPTSLHIGNHVRNDLFQLATILKTNQTNNNLTNTQHQLKSPNQHSLITSK